MNNLPMPRFPRTRLALAAALLLPLLAWPAAQAQTDRERQQLMQLQQQLQKLRQENTQLQQGQQGKVQEAEKARAEADKVRREASQLRAAGSGSQREARRLAEELAAATQALQQSRAEADKLKADLAQREAALQAAAQQLVDDKRAAEASTGVLGARLKANTARADVCEAKHEAALAVARDVIGRYESRQLRACEPFTDLWRVREEHQIQALRDRLFESRLDVPAQSASGDGTK